MQRVTFSEQGTMSHKMKKRRASRKAQKAGAARRKRLLRFLEGDSPGWKDADHPELKHGAAAWVRKLRRSG